MVAGHVGSSCFNVYRTRRLKWGDATSLVLFRVCFCVFCFCFWLSDNQQPNPRIAAGKPSDYSVEFCIVAPMTGPNCVVLGYFHFIQP